MRARCQRVSAFYRPFSPVPRHSLFCCCNMLLIAVKSFRITFSLNLYRLVWHAHCASTPAACEFSSPVFFLPPRRALRVLFSVGFFPFTALLQYTLPARSSHLREAKNFSLRHFTTRTQSNWNTHAFNSFFLFIFFCVSLFWMFSQNRNADWSITTAISSLQQR